MSTTQKRNQKLERKIPQDLINQTDMTKLPKS